MKRLIFLLLFFCNRCLAQFYHPENIGPVYFDQFAKAPKIDWAAFFIDTFCFDKTNLSEILRKRFEANKIKVRTPGELISYYKPEIKYSTKSDLEKFHKGGCVLPIFDSAGNIPKTDDKKKFPPNFDSSDYNLVDIAQVYYIEGDKLKVYVPFVSPKLSVYTSQGVNLGLTDYFVTAFNFKYNYSQSSGDKIKFVQQTNKKIYLDSIGKKYGSYYIKQFYGRNFAETLWPLIISEKLNVISLDTNKKLSKTELDEMSNPSPSFVIPQFDSNGNITHNSTIYIEPTNPSVFKELEIAQNWYYNETKNIVFCTIPQMVFYIYRFKNGEFEKELSPVFKIIF